MKHPEVILFPFIMAVEYYLMLVGAKRTKIRSALD